MVQAENAKKEETQTEAEGKQETQIKAESKQETQTIKAESKQEGENAAPVVDMKTEAAAAGTANEKSAVPVPAAPTTAMKKRARDDEGNDDAALPEAKRVAGNAEAEGKGGVMKMEEV